LRSRSLARVTGAVTSPFGTQPSIVVNRREPRDDVEVSEGLTAMPIPLRVILLEDDPSDAELIVRELMVAGFEPDWKRVETRGEFLAALAASCDLVLADYFLPQYDGITGLRDMRARGLDTPFIVVSGAIGEELAVAAVQEGAADYLSKDRLSRLGPAVLRALEHRELRRRSRAAEESQRESERLYRSLFQNMLNGVAYCRMLFENGEPRDFEYLAVNDAFESQTGLKDVGGKKASEVIPGIQESDPRLFEIYGRVARTGQPEQFEMFVESMQMWFSISAYSAEYGYFAAVFDVISERKRAERALSESEERLRLIVETSPDLIAWLDSEGRLLFANSAHRTVLGYEPDALRDQNMLEFVHPDDRATAVQRLSALPRREDAPSAAGVFRFRDSAGHWVPLEMRALPFPGSAGALVASRDVTDRLRAEEELRESEERYRLLVNKSPYAIAVHQDGKLVFVNRAAESLLGAASAGELIGRSIRAILPPDWWEEAEHRMERVLQGETASIRLEMRFVRLDGREVPVETTAAPFRFNGRPAVQVIALDISERKQAEEALRTSETLYRSILASSPDAVAITDMDGRVCVCSPAALTMFGVETADSLLGQLITDFVVPEDRNQAYTNIGRMAERGADRSERRPNEYRVARADGTVFDAEVLGEFIRDAAGLPTGVIFDVRDVTDRKRAEESVARLAAIVASSNDAILTLAPDRSVLSWNKAAEDLYGWPAGEAIGHPLFELISTPPELRDRQGQVLDRAFAGEATNGYDTVRFGRDGERIDVALTVFPIRDAGGAVVAVGGIHRDIGARRQSEQMLRESEERLRATFEQAAVGIAHVALDGHWLRVNQKFCSIVGYSREELLRKSFQDLTHPDDLQRDLDNIPRMLSGELRTYAAEKRYLREDGSPVWVDLSASLVRTATDEPDYFISIIEDISARKQAEAMLDLESAALNAAADAMVITDREGTIEWVNPAFVVVNGYTAEEALGKNPRELVKSGVHDTGFYRRMWDTILAGDVWKGELTNRRKDGSLYFEEQTITPVKGASGEIAHFIAIKRDITERKRLEAELLQSHKMESIGQLAGGIAHDFNNILNVISGTAFLISQQLQSGDPLQDDLREITMAADRATAMTRQLLAMSRKQIMQPKVFDLGALVENMRGMLQRLIGEDIDVVVAPATGSCAVTADPGQIEQVVMNLALNARDAMPTGGTLTIEVGPARVGRARSGPPLAPGEYVRLQVGDTGVGMDEATRKRIFEPFFTTKEVGKGTGLGLSTVYGIVQQSGGSISVDSKRGVGTTFRVYFPRVTEAEGDDQTAPQATLERAGETILVVEDYAGLRQLARAMLDKAGYKVLLAANGKEALELLERHNGRVDLLLTDVVMPEMNGRELAAHIEASRPGIKVIYASGYTDDALLRHGVQTDAAHFLGKPYTYEDLTRVVRNVLDAG
jgi:two-component system, cell cycle sensor histidine kinase and response regulator CckA